MTNLRDKFPELHYLIELRIGDLVDWERLFEAQKEAANIISTMSKLLAKGYSYDQSLRKFVENIENE